MNKLLKDASLEEIRVELNQRLSNAIHEPPYAYIGVHMNLPHDESEKSETWQAREDINIDIANLANDIEAADDGEYMISKRIDSIVSVCDSMGFTDLQILN